MEIPTASPFFSGLPNQIMYCISTPTTYAGYAATASTDHKKIDASQVVTNQTNHYYYPPQNVPPPPPSAPPVQAFSVPTTTTASDEFKSPIFDANRSQNRFFEEEGRNFECSVCHKKFRQKGTLQQHERIHLDFRPFQCTHENCNKRFRQKAILNQHMRIHCDASAQLIFKNLGNNGILWPQNVPYPDEIRNENTESSEKVSLPQIIHSVFGTLNEESKKEDGQKVAMPLFVRCPICQQEFKQKSTLVQRGCIHIESRPYTCLVVNCGRRFRQQSHLQQHNRIHENSKPYKCPYCEKFFRQRTILNQHIRLHTNEKPYRCRTCFKDFRQQAILSSHEKSHLGLTLGCPLTNCKRRFASDNDLRKHIESHMNLSTKPTKKQSSGNKSINKTELSSSFTQSYPPTIYFNPPISTQ